MVSRPAHSADPVRLRNVELPRPHGHLDIRVVLEQDRFGDAVTGRALGYAELLLHEFLHGAVTQDLDDVQPAEVPYETGEQDLLGRAKDRNLTQLDEGVHRVRRVTRIAELVHLLKEHLDLFQGLARGFELLGIGLMERIGSTEAPETRGGVACSSRTLPANPASARTAPMQSYRGAS